MTIAKITIPKFANVILLEDSEMRIAWFQKRIPERLTVVKNVDDFVKACVGADLFFLDHDLGGEQFGDGYQAAKYLAENFGTNGRNITIHSINAVGVSKMRGYLSKAICIPFGDFEVEVEQ